MGPPASPLNNEVRDGVEPLGWQAGGGWGGGATVEQVRTRGCGRGQVRVAFLVVPWMGTACSVVSGLRKKEAGKEGGPPLLCGITYSCKKQRHGVRQNESFE